MSLVLTHQLQSEFIEPIDLLILGIVTEREANVPRDMLLSAKTMRTFTPDVSSTESM